MIDALISPLFYVATGLGFLVYLVVALVASKVIRAWPGRWFGMGMLVAPVGFLLLATAFKSGSDNSALLVLGAGGVFLLASILVGIGLMMTARAQRIEASQ